MGENRQPEKGNQMSMKKMLLLATMSLAAVAFAVPAAAQGQTHGLTENGEFLEENAPVTITSTDLITTTSSGTMACKKVTLHYEVVTNSDEHAVLAPVGAHNATTEECHLVTTNGTTHVVHISEAGAGETTINTWGTGVASSTFTTRITTPFFTATCKFSGNVHIEGQEPGSDKVNIGPSGLTGSGFGCPSSGTIEGTGTMETPDGKPITGDFVDTTP